MAAFPIPASDRYRQTVVPVLGGELAVGNWRPAPGLPESGLAGADRAVLAVHGITGNHLCWPYLVDALADASVVAPDLRGRGGSCNVPGPYGLAVHADDMVRVLDHAGIQQAVVVGHSMGAFIALLLADRHPDRVSSLVLVDGGLPITERVPRNPRAAARTVATSISARLELEFSNLAAGVFFWRSHPAFERDFSPVVQEYAEYDLGPWNDGVRSRTRPSAIEQDSLEVMAGMAHRDALKSLSHPTQWLTASRGLLDEPPGMYPPSLLMHWRECYPGIELRPVHHVNHYTIVLSRRGGDAIGQAVRRALEGQVRPPHGSQPSSV